MSDLFRFLLIRAPREIEAKGIDVIADLGPEETQAGPLDLANEDVVLGLNAELVEKGGTAKTIKEAIGDGLNEERFKADSAAVGRAIARLKLRQQPTPGHGADDLLELRRRFDLVIRAIQADGQDVHIHPRPTAIDQDLLTGGPAEDDQGEEEDPAAARDPDARAADDDESLVVDLEAALHRLAQLTPEDVKLPPEGVRSSQWSFTPAGSITSWESPQGDAQPTQLVLGQAFLDALPDSLAEDVQAVTLESGEVPLGPLFDRLLERRRTLPFKPQPDAGAASRDEPAPPQPLISGGREAMHRPQGKLVRPEPIGVGDLLITREHLKGYVGGDVAHIENVLRSEKRERRTRRLERTEELTLVETERASENERDTQSTDRFALNRETNETLRQDTSLQAGVNVTARYGPMVEVNANLDYQSQTSSERTERVATEFSRDVVDRSLQRLSERTRELRSTLRIQEFEDRNVHGFKNQDGATNISGVYQWVNRVNEAQVVNYGRRIMFDLILLDPALFYIHANNRAASAAGRLRDPGEFTLRPNDITEWNYLEFGRTYEATNLDPPPPVTTAVSKAITETKEAGTAGLIAKSEVIAIPQGYQALAAEWTRTLTYQGELPFQLFSGIVIAGRFFGIAVVGGGTITGLAPIQGDIQVVVAGGGVLAIAVSVKVSMLRTAAGRAAWQAKVHAALYQAYLAKRAEYDRAVAERLASAVQIRGRNPLRNDEIVRVELRRSAQSALVGFNLPGGPAPVDTPEGYPELAPNATIAPAIRFLEQSFEWDQMTFTFLPYYWGSKENWKDRVLLDDTNDLFARFLRAGAVRVTFPVRRNFEAAVLHFFETGDLWKEGDPPPVVGERFLPMLEEIRSAAEFPAEGVSVGTPWEIRVPTTLVKLRPDDKLPMWVKGKDGQWKEAAEEDEPDEDGPDG